MPRQSIFGRLSPVKLDRYSGAVPLIITAAAAALSGGCATAPPAQANLDATLWVQTATEYDAVTRSVYSAALEDLDALLADSTWSAALEQREPYGELPPAIILDVDETVLDNVAYQARLLLSGEAYSSDTWATWVEERAAGPVPGSLEFTNAANDLGIAVFYVTNRRSHLEQATRDNLAALGFPLRSDLDAVLTRGEKPGWDGAKSSRRESVARTHRVLMLVGDDLNDFVDAGGLSVDARAELAGGYREYWGHAWRMLPNPTYGSWERALVDGETGLSPAERTRRKAEHLEPKGETHE